MGGSGLSRLKGDFDNIQEVLAVTVACPSICLARCRVWGENVAKIQILPRRSLRVRLMSERN